MHVIIPVLFYFNWTICMKIRYINSPSLSSLIYYAIHIGRHMFVMRVIIPLLFYFNWTICMKISMIIIKSNWTSIAWIFVLHKQGHVISWLHLIKKHSDNAIGSLNEEARGKTAAPRNFIPRTTAPQYWHLLIICATLRFWTSETRQRTLCHWYQTTTEANRISWPPVKQRLRQGQHIDKKVTWSTKLGSRSHCNKLTAAIPCRSNRTGCVSAPIV